MSGYYRLNMFRADRLDLGIIDDMVDEGVLERIPRPADHGTPLFVLIEGPQLYVIDGPDGITKMVNGRLRRARCPETGEAT